MKNMHQPPNYQEVQGHAVVLENLLYLGGEDDVDELLYGEAAYQLNQMGVFKENLNPQVEVWVDLRDLRETNRKVYLPNQVEYKAFPFQDGDKESLQEVLPLALQFLNEQTGKGKRVLVTCHQGRSRSVMLALLYLCEKTGSFDKSYWTLKSARPVMNPDRNFLSVLEEWKVKYPLPDDEW